MPGSHPIDVLKFCMTQRHLGHAVCLMILTRVTGGTLRETGALMAITEDGSSCGYISNGCVDADIMAQGQMALAINEPRYVRYGEGSPFLDITLPCGGAIDLALLPNPDISVIEAANHALTSRRSVILSLTEGAELIMGEADKMRFSHLYSPPLRLRIAGRGEAVLQLAQQGKAAGFLCHIQSPDKDLLNLLRPDCETTHLHSPNIMPDAADDIWTAVIVLFHDHDWEPELLRKALLGDAFYIGAMGSVKTHAIRCERLKAAGVTDEQLAKIHAPIGLLPAMRSANHLALSILSEIIAEAQTLGRL